MRIFEFEEILPDVKTLGVEELAKLHNVNIDYIRNQLNKGIEIELEHTTNKNLAREIALDHLKEMPNYYDKLSDMEKENKRER